MKSAIQSFGQVVQFNSLNSLNLIMIDKYYGKAMKSGVAAAKAGIVLTSSVGKIRNDFFRFVLFMLFGTT